MTTLERPLAAGLLAAMLAACSPDAMPAIDEPERVTLSDSVPGVQSPQAATPAAPVLPPTDSGQAQGENMLGGSDPGAGPQQQQASALDPRLVGTWVHEQQINSGGGAGGFASLSTVMTMVLNGDGSIQQFTQSVGGGSEWSSDSGRTLDFEGRWRAANGTLSVHGMGLPDFTPAATYSFSGDYLVTQSDMGRLIWQRR